ncbi:MAG: tyrosine-type recombinase/integrase [Planctomycetes bacterium]|nr:tyrosine-type recombinase/integrase [Planctomycetota bacterium]
MTGKEKQESLTALGKTTVESRRTWCENKADSLNATKSAIAAGTATTTQTAVSKAIEAYYTAKEAELRPRTLVAYKQGTAPFEAWCASKPLPIIEGLTAPLLAQYRTWFVGLLAHVPAKGQGVGKGKRLEGKQKKSPAQQNKQLNSLRIVLSQLRREGKLPNLTSDSIYDSLPFVKRERTKPRFLDTLQIRKLLEAVQRYDAEGNAPFAPFTLAALLTGMRFTELAELTWDEVSIEKQEITLSVRTKTKTERTVSLEKMPSIVAMLARMKLARSKDESRVFPHVTHSTAVKARKLLQRAFASGKFTWHDCRRTCGTYSVCSSLYGRDSISETSWQLGHGKATAEQFYTGRAKDFLPGATTLEAAMKCSDLFEAIAGCNSNARDVRRETAKAAS